MSKVICADLGEYDNTSIQVFFGEQATMDIPVALNYIKSGEVEIQRYADNVIIPKFNEYENNAQRYSLMAEESAQRSEFAKKEVEKLEEDTRLLAIGTLEEFPDGSARYWAEESHEKYLEVANYIADDILGEKDSVISSATEITNDILGETIPEQGE